MIGLTANALRAELDKCTEAGMNTVLTKPFLEEDLLRSMLALAPIRTNTSSHDRLCDLSKLRAIAQGDEAFVMHMIKLFSEQGPATVSEMRSASKAGDAKRVGDLAHRLKSSVDSLGIAKLHDAVRELEALGKTGEASVRIEELLEELERVIALAVVELLA